MVNIPTLSYNQARNSSKTLNFVLEQYNYTFACVIPYYSVYFPQRTVTGWIEIYKNILFNSNFLISC